MSARSVAPLCWLLCLPMLACVRDSRGSRDPGPEPPTLEEAKHEFVEVARRYALAKEGTELSGPECDRFAAEFLSVYKRYGAAMAVAGFNAGAVLEECGEVERAEDIYETIIAGVPTYDLAYNNLGVIFWNRGQEQRALQYFERAVEANPTTPAPRNNLAAALRQKYASSPAKPDFDRAELELKNVLAVEPSNRLAYENLARLYYDRGRLGERSYLLLADLVVTQAMRTLEKHGARSSADLYNIRGLLYMERDNQVDALAAFEKAAEIEPEHSDANMNIAMISIRFRAYAQAEESLEIALGDRRKERDVEAYLALGVARRGLRKYEQAEKAFLKASKLDGADPRPLYNLGILYQEHIAASSAEFDEKSYRTARKYLTEFATTAGDDQELQGHVTDAKARVHNIDRLIADVADMEKLAAEARRLEALQEKQEAEDRRRRLDLEAKAKAAAQEQ